MLRNYLLILFFLVACIKEELIGDKYVQLSYSQTYCADPWPAGASDSATMKNIVHHLDSLNLYVASIEIKKETTAETCLACTCHTGNVIHVTTLDSKGLKEKYSAIGFK